MSTISLLGLIISVLLTAVLWLARRQGRKRQEINQIEQQNREMSTDAKIDAQPDLRGDDLRNAWHDELRKDSGK